MGRRAQINRQLYEKDFQVIDGAISLPDGANTGFDLYTSINGVTDYTNLVVSYGEFQWIAVEFRYMPYFRYSAVVTDYAIGAFGVREGTFDVTVTAKSETAVLQLPGSFLVTNKDPFSYNTEIVHKTPISTSDTNTAQSEVPKVNFYVGYGTAATTNTGLGVLHVRLLVKAFSKKE